LSKSIKKNISTGPRLERSLEALLALICEYKELEDTRTLFTSIESMLIKEFNISPFLVYSKPSNIENENYLRNHWNKKELKYYEKEELNSFLSKINKENFEECISLLIDQNFYFSMPLGKKDDQFFFCLWKSENIIPSDFLEYLLKFLKTTFGMICQWEEVSKERELIYRDDVTNLFNQRKLTLDLDTSILRFHKFKESFSILFIDIDHFKSVNDSYGHLVGTRILADVAIFFKKTLRPTDLVYRYGGDEFVVILPDTDLATGSSVGERVLSNIKNESFYINESVKSKKLSVSIGVASFPQNARDQQEILEIADKMMYEAKETGRGKVTTANVILPTNNKQV
jgi:diguanylate cyclase (GGDEF)-like protein